MFYIVSMKKGAKIMKNMIETKNLTKTYKAFTAVDHVSLHIKKGSIYGFLGPNGAGKSTTMKMLLGLTAPTDGEFQIDNLTFPNDRVQILKKIGSFIESPSFYQNLTGKENLDIIPTSIDLSAAEIELIGVDDKEYILRNAIDQVKDQYDFVIIDCPPSLSMLTINAMTTADSVIVPIQCEYYALEGLSQLIHTVELVKDRLNSKLEIEGVVFTMYDARTNLSLQVVENVKDNLQQNIYKTIIPRNIRLAEAPSYGLPINKYDPKSTGAESYMRLADEVIEREE